MHKLTGLEKRIISVIRHHFSVHQESPTLSEIGEAVGLRSKGTVRRYVLSLINKGFLQRRQEKTWRNIELTHHAEQSLYSLPLLGRIAAGRPIEAIPGMDELNLFGLFQGANRFALQTTGDSMTGIGILDGDWVIIEPADHIKNGDLVAALIDNSETTLKRFKRQDNGQIDLIAENPNIPVMRYEAEQVQIQGILVGQIRCYT